MRVLWLPDVLRAAGLTVHEVAGWKNRGADSFGPVRGITCHHTAGSRTSTDAGEINTLVNGRPGLSGPIAQLYLSRTGDWHVVASGHCNHNLVGWAGPNEGYGNDAILGIEAQHSGGDEPWTDRQYNSYVRGVAALMRHQASGWDVTVGRVAGHKEHQPGAKTDPSFDMTAFRARVRAEIDNWEGGDMLVKKGDTGEDVKFWQYILNDLGYPVTVDGDYGDKTEAAVNAHRKALGQNALTYISGYHGFAMLRAMMDKRAGKAGPAGPAGAPGVPGPAGPKGDRGPAGELAGTLDVTGGQLTVKVPGA